jgi:ATP-dependent DNA ligase
MGLKPILAETMPEGRLDKYIADPEWVAEQKLDGQRILIHVDDRNVTALQRQGKPTSKDVPQTIIGSFTPLIGKGEWYFDGEMVADQSNRKTLWLFDMPLAGDHVTPDSDLEYRKQMLDGFYGGFWEGNESVRLLPTFYDNVDKADLVERVRANGGEGTIFKHLGKPYDQPRNPNAAAGVRSRWVLKSKNWNSVDCVVTAIRLDGKDNIQVGVIDPSFTGRTVLLGGWNFRIIGEVTALEHRLRAYTSGFMPDAFDSGQRVRKLLALGQGHLLDPNISGVRVVHVVERPSPFR